MCLSYSILYLCCKVHSKIPNDCQDFANLLQGYFNLSHPVYSDIQLGSSSRLYGLTLCNAVMKEASDLNQLL